MWGYEKKTRIEKIYDNLKFYSSYEYKKDAMKFIKQGHIDEIYPYFSDDLLADILIFIINNNLEFKSAINDANKLFELIAFNKNDEEQKNLFLKFFYQYELNPNLPQNFQYFSHVYSLFENKKLLLNLYSKLSSYHEANYYVVMLIFDYIENARKYYVDETAFYSSIIGLINKIEEAAFNKDRVEELIANNIDVDKKIAGIYDIDENELESLPTKIGDAANRHQALENKQLELDDKLKEAEAYIGKVVEIIDKKQEKSEVRYKETLEELKKMCDDFKNIIDNYKWDIVPQDSNVEISSSKLDILIDQLIKFNEGNNLDKQNIDKSDEEEISLKEEIEQCDGAVNLFKEGFNINSFFEKYYSTGKFSNYTIPEVSNGADLIPNDKTINNEILTSRIYSLIGKINENLRDLGYCLYKTELINPKFIKYIKSYYILDKPEKIDYLMNDTITFDYLLKYYYALYNNSLDVFKFVNSHYDLGNCWLWVFDREIIDQFDKDEYFNMLINDIDLLREAIDYNDIENLKKILAKNSNFELKYDYSCLNIIKRYFNTDLIASNNPAFDASMKLICDLDREFEEANFPYLREIYIINPNFRLYNIGIISRLYTDKIKSLFGTEEIAYLTEKQQNSLMHLVLFSTMSKDDIRKIVLSNPAFELGTWDIELLENKKFNLSLDEFLKLDSESVMLLHRCYLDYADTSSLSKKIIISKVLKKSIKNINSGIYSGIGGKE